MNTVQKVVAILLIISVLLSSALAVQVMRDGGLALGQLVSPATQPSSATPAAQEDGNKNATSASTGAPESAILDTESAALNQVFKKAGGSVVQITSSVKTVVPNIIINGNPLESQSTRLGSGFVYDTDGRIITNNHVIDGSKSVDVTFVDGNTYSAKVVGTDAFSDIAVLQITDDFSGEHLAPLSLGNSSQLQVGQQAIAIGNPFGLSDTMTTGIVSQVGRLLPNQEIGFSIPNAIQTDAAINPGNSGGPLLDIQGNVVGVNTAIKSNTGDFSGIGFAIPANAVARIVPHLIKEGKYDHPWLGISGASLTPDLAEKLGLPRDFRGVAIASVTPGGPADKAGIAGSSQKGVPAGDVITAIDGHAVKRIEDIIFHIEEQASVGDKVTITVHRDGQSQDLTATLEARPLPVMQTN
ncbi:MAG TPA: trypsin-like peptidase domain-containing protein [Nitrososphaera sp.]